MLSWIALLCLFAAVAFLATLSVIDLKTRLLPNELVAGFATAGLVFHLTTLAEYISIDQIIAGGVIGFGSLYVLRAAANHYYGQDALGLGDVKLMGAAGLWLGIDGILLALTLGASASVLHGLAVGLAQARDNRSKPDFAKLQIPAGPGFAVGIVLTGFYIFRHFRLEGL